MNSEEKRQARILAVARCGQPAWPISFGFVCFRTRLADLANPRMRQRMQLLRLVPCTAYEQFHVPRVRSPRGIHRDRGRCLLAWYSLDVPRGLIPWKVSLPLLRLISFFADFLASFSSPSSSRLPADKINRDGCSLLLLAMHQTDLARYRYGDPLRLPLHDGAD